MYTHYTTKYAHTVQICDRMENNIRSTELVRFETTSTKGRRSEPSYRHTLSAYSMHNTRGMIYKFGSQIIVVNRFCCRRGNKKKLGRRYLRITCAYTVILSAHNNPPPRRFHRSYRPALPLNRHSDENKYKQSRPTGGDACGRTGNGGAR